MAIAIVRQSLMMKLVHENIGFQAIIREEFIQRHVTEFSNVLYNADPERQIAMIYEDCTYLDIEKSSCFAALRNYRSPGTSRVFLVVEFVTSDLKNPRVTNLNAQPHQIARALRR